MPNKSSISFRLDVNRSVQYFTCQTKRVKSRKLQLMQVIEGALAIKSSESAYLGVDYLLTLQYVTHLTC